MSIGQKIKKVREFKNLTQEHLAEKLGMSVAGYGKIEREDTDVPFSRLEQIAATLNMKTEELVGFDENTVFNFMNNQTGINNFYNKSSISEKERELYDKNIQLLEEKITWLESLVKK
jgi:transcriptional regulator with XRE-family HTH domain